MWAGVEELFWKKYAQSSCKGDMGVETGNEIPKVDPVFHDLLNYV